MQILVILIKELNLYQISNKIGKTPFQMKSRKKVRVGAKFIMRIQDISIIKSKRGLKIKTKSRKKACVGANLGAPLTLSLPTLRGVTGTASISSSATSSSL